MNDSDKKIIGAVTQRYRFAKLVQIRLLTCDNTNSSEAIERIIELNRSSKYCNKDTKNQLQSHTTGPSAYLIR